MAHTFYNFYYRYLLKVAVHYFYENFILFIITKYDFKSGKINALYKTNFKRYPTKISNYSYFSVIIILFLNIVFCEPKSNMFKLSLNICSSYQCKCKIKNLFISILIHHNYNTCKC